MITTISKSPLNVIPLEESHAIALSFVATNELTEGVPVALAASGEVDVIPGDGTVEPIGIVTRGNKTHVYSDIVTVVTDFKQVLNVNAEGAVVAGGLAVFHAYDATDGLQYKAGTTGNIALGMFLGSAADGESVQVGIFRSPRTVA